MRPRRLVSSSVTCVLLALAAVIAHPAWAESSATAERLRAQNAELLALESAAPAEPRTARGDAAPTLLAERAATLRSLIVNDPSQALALAFPREVLADLAAAFPEERALLEERGAWSGRLEYLIEDSATMTSHRKVFRLHRADGVLELHVAGPPPPASLAGQSVKVHGVRLGTYVAAGEFELLDAAPGAGDATLDGSPAPYPATCSIRGPQSLLSVLVNLPGYKLPSGVTAEFVRGVLLGNDHSTSKHTPNWSVDDFWAQSSDGQTYLDPANTTVVGPLEMTSNYNTDGSGANYCDNYALLNAVLAQLDGTVDFRRYGRLQIILPGNGACTWAGTANVGCTVLSTPGDGSFPASVSWYRAETMTSRASAVQLHTHELGHNLGLLHAASRDFGAEALGAPGTYGSVSEYGDRFSTMGSWNLGFYAAPHAASMLGWLKAGTHVQTVTTPGTYTIQNYEGRPAAVKALKVRRGTATDQWLWVESRQNTGLYSSQLSPAVFGGALIHYEDPLTGGYTHLLDFTPATAEFADAALAVGQTWSDPHSSLSLTVSAVSPTGLTLQVSYGAPTCTRANPAVSLTPAVASADYGTSVPLTLTVTNRDSASCAADTFNLAAALPAGWSGALSSSALTIGPGQVASAAVTATIPSPYALGTYTVSTTASAVAGRKSGSASASTTVTAPPPTCTYAAPTVTVLPNAITTASGTSVAFSVKVKNNSSAACAAELFSFTLSKPSSWTRTWSATSLSLAPGAEQTANLRVDVPAGYEASTRTLTVRSRSVPSGLSRSASAKVTVVAPAPVCERRAPSIAIAPASVDARAGESRDFVLTVANNSTAACASESINLAATVPTGWSKTLGVATVSLAPGGRAETTLRVGVPATATPGSRTLGASANSAVSTLSGTAAANVNVVAPASRKLSLSIVGQGGVEVSPLPSGSVDSFCWTACSYDYAGMPSTTQVTLTVVLNDPTSFVGWSGACTGTSLTCKVVLSADRSVTATIKPPGT